MLKKTALAALVAAVLPLAQAQAADYKIDSEGQHAFIQFKISHLGYSYILGDFKQFSGDFSYDPDAPEQSSVAVKVDVDSLDSNHAERDKHILSGDFLDAGKYPQASFKSTSFQIDDDGEEGEMTGELTLHGVTREVTFDVDHIGGGDDPWGGYRQGFEATTTLNLADFDIDMSKFPEPMRSVDLYVVLEGIRQ
ncbi:YceI family protein [Salinicola sp. JS01]|uniref:YceI family protein n=1 Tax=Salinicola sp. JS01 TaxID=3050071 RepID=UPI00255B71E7|nr:YceI family protein [Salinicola sp. JS01]WIX35035.1 YceI family protein [Salinicola sp. JS01]